VEARARDAAVTWVQDAVVGTGLGCGGCSFHEGLGGSSVVAREARRVASRCGSSAGCGGAASAGGGVGSGGRWRQDDGHQVARPLATRV